MREPHGGTRIDAEERAWVVANKGPQHVRTCARCGLEYFSPRLSSDTCYVCWYEDAMKQAEARFKPLSDELEKRLEVKTSVDQTGGMTMCLRVPIGREVDRYSNSRKWAWFSELAPDEIGVGLYEVDENGDIGNGYGDGEYVEWPGDFQCAGEPGCNWYHHPELCKEVADWAAPLILEFATRETGA